MRLIVPAAVDRHAHAAEHRVHGPRPRTALMVPPRPAPLPPRRPADPGVVRRAAGARHHRRDGGLGTAAGGPDVRRPAPGPRRAADAVPAPVAADAGAAGDRLGSVRLALPRWVVVRPSL